MHGAPVARQDDHGAVLHDAVDVARLNVVPDVDRVPGLQDDAGREIRGDASESEEQNGGDDQRYGDDVVIVFRSKLIERSATSRYRGSQRQSGPSRSV